MVKVRNPWRAVALVLVPGFLALAACSDLLEVTDPDLIEKDDISGAKGADLLWGGGLLEFSRAFVTAPNGSGHVLISALMADEFHSVGPDGGHADVDLRKTKPENGRLKEAFQYLHRARVATENAADFLAELAPGDHRIAELQNLNAYTYVMLAEDFCSGVPFSRTTLDGEVSLGEPETTQEVFEEALARFQRVLSDASGTSDQEYLARVGMARALLNLARYSEAAATVAPVPTEWAYKVYFGSAQWNAITLNSESRFSLSDHEGGTGLPFRSAQDPRVPWIENGMGTAGSSPLFTQRKFASNSSPVTLANGFEARYIEAEYALSQGNVAEFLRILNEVREALGMDPVDDPASPEALVGLLFYERGFTLFGEGHRLGDLRRLVRQYGRDPEEVFPTGNYHLTGKFYGSDVNLELPYAEIDNPNFVGCLDRGA